MVLERMIASLQSHPVPASGCLGSGVWHLEALADRDITVENGSDASLLIFDGDASAEINIDVESGAKLRILNIVNHKSASTIAIAIAEGSECRMTQVVCSSSDSRVVASLMDRDARFELGGVFVLTDDDQTSVTADVNHISPDCVSRILVKGVASGRSHGRFSGLVYVAPDAQHTDSSQTNRNVTIGEGRIETLPQLEIYADDVKCSHGATVGQMDSDAILYMRQRGLSLVDAKRLQIEGFVDDIVLHSAIEGDEVTESLTAMLAEKLNLL